MTPPVYKRVLAVLLPLVLLGALGAAVALHLARAPGPDGYAGHTVLLNEVCAKNLTGLTDADGNTGDWVELINVSGEDIVLDGCRPFPPTAAKPGRGKPPCAFPADGAARASSRKTCT